MKIKKTIVFSPKETRTFQTLRMWLNSLAVEMPNQVEQVHQMLDRMDLDRPLTIHELDDLVSPLGLLAVQAKNKAGEENTPALMAARHYDVEEAFSLAYEARSLLIRKRS